MEVKPGYKQTEVGVIPEEWTSLRLSQIVQESRIPTGLYKEQTLYGNGSPIIKLGDVFGNDYFNPHIAQRVQLRCEEISRFRVQLGDIIIALASVKLEGVGKVMLVEDLHEDTVFDHNVALIRLVKGYDPKFVFYLFKSFVVRALVSKRATQVGTTFLKASSILNFELPIPSTNNEQRAIAAALSDVDALLAKLDQFIVKKRDLKQAAMQQLLTGQTRLPGFSGEWETVQLPDVSWFQEGPGVRTHQFTLSGVKLLNGTNISNGRLLLDSTMRYVSNGEAEGAYKHFLVDEGDILLATSGVTIDKLHEKVAVAQHEQLPLCMNTSTVRFKVTNSRLITSYLYLFLRSDVFKKQIGRQATGSAQLNFGPSHLKKVDIPLPPSLPEQTAIATVLSDMDAELAALEARRNKTRDLKQGMMQELLTGRIRLV
jgi:type I restriction enzyme S subunit